MRPKNEIRAAIESAAMNLQRGTFKAFAAAAQVGYDAAQVVVANMAKAGLLRADGTEAAGRGRPLVVYAYVGHLPAANDASTTLVANG